MPAWPFFPDPWTLCENAGTLSPEPCSSHFPAACQHGVSTEWWWAGSAEEDESGCRVMQNTGRTDGRASRGVPRQHSAPELPASQELELGLQFSQCTAP